MAIAPTYPGVYIDEIPSTVHPIAGVSATIMGFVGYTARGIDNAYYCACIASSKRRFPPWRTSE
jgi:phage tail sheath protein FI